MSTSITLPLPPSVNSIWRVGRGGRVHKSKRYTQWQRTAGWELVLQKPKHFIGAIKVNVAAGKPNRRRDVDNLGKAVLDLLQAHKVIRDDADVVSLTTSWDANVAPGRVVIAVTAAN